MRVRRVSDKCRHVSLPSSNTDCTFPVGNHKPIEMRCEMVDAVLKQDNWGSPARKGRRATVLHTVGTATDAKRAVQLLARFDRSRQRSNTSGAGVQPTCLGHD